MSLEHVFKETRIKLPKSLDIEGTENLFEYLANQLPGDVKYRVSYYKDMVHGSKDEGLLKFDGSVEVNGSIRNYRKGGYDWFSSELDESDPSKISLIKFNIVPGWSLPEYRKEVVELWHEVRDLITKYFNKN